MILTYVTKRKVKNNRGKSKYNRSNSQKMAIKVKIKNV